MKRLYRPRRPVPRERISSSTITRVGDNLRPLTADGTSALALQECSRSCQPRRSENAKQLLMSRKRGRMGFMRVAVVTDIHGNRRALQAVLADLKHVAPDLILHGGDLVFGGTRPADVIDEIRSLGWPGVLGNTDEVLWTEEWLTEMNTAHPKLTPLLGRLRELIAPM